MKNKKVDDRNITAPAACGRSSSSITNLNEAICALEHTADLIEHSGLLSRLKVIISICESSEEHYRQAVHDEVDGFFRDRQIILDQGTDRHEIKMVSEKLLQLQRAIDSLPG